MDFAFFSIAFNIKKVYSMMAKQGKNMENTSNFALFLFIF